MTRKFASFWPVLFCLCLGIGCTSDDRHNHHPHGPETLLHYSRFFEGELIDAAQNAVPLADHVCLGDAGQLVTPCANAADGDLSTAVSWKTDTLGDFEVRIVNTYAVAEVTEGVVYRFKASHTNHGSLIPSPMTVCYWNGTMWIRLYVLDDQEHQNETFVETIALPQQAFADNELRLQIAIRYSSHVAGGVGL